MNSWPKRNFDNISASFRGMYCFEQLELSATYSLMALMRLMCLWLMLFATMATLSVSIVLMRLGSFTYSTFGSHCGQSFKLFYKKIKKPLHKQGLHPAEIPKVLKRDGLLGFTMHIIWKLCLTSFMANLPWLGRPQKLSMEANSVCRNCAK